MSTVLQPDLEQLAELVHQAYLGTCRHLGKPVDQVHDVPYAQLADDVKEVDRATARAVCAGVADLLRAAGVDPQAVALVQVLARHRPDPA